jgi:hypothetical protein
MIRRSRSAAAVAVVALGAARPGHADPDDDGPPLVMAVIDPRAALTVAAQWLRGTGPAVDGVIGTVAYRHQLGARAWLEGGLGIQWAAVAPQAGLSLTNATIDAGYRLGHRAAIRIRIGLPSAASGGRSGAAAAAIAALRIDDRAVSAASTTSVGAYGDWRTDGLGDHAKAYGQIEAGLELWSGDSVTPAIRLGVGGGVHVAHRLVLAGELTTMSFILAAGGPEDFIHALDLGASVRIPTGAITARLEVPLDNSFRARDAVLVGLAYRWER